MDQRDLYITHSSPTRRSRRILEEKSQITRSPEVIDQIEELYGPIQEEGLKDFCKKYQEAWQTFHSTGHRIYNVDFPSIRAMRLSAQIQTYDLLEDQRKKVTELVEKIINRQHQDRIVLPRMKVFAVTRKHFETLDYYYQREMEYFDSWIQHRIPKYRRFLEESASTPETPAPQDSPSETQQSAPEKSSDLQTANTGENDSLQGVYDSSSAEENTSDGSSQYTTIGSASSSDSSEQDQESVQDPTETSLEKPNQIANPGSKSLPPQELKVEPGPSPWKKEEIPTRLDQIPTVQLDVREKWKKSLIQNIIS